MQTLFNPFKQTQRLAGGTGLGLYSLAKRIEALNGQYGVHKRLDGKQGSVFWFTVPYRPDHVVASMMEEESGVNSVRHSFVNKVSHVDKGQAKRYRTRSIFSPDLDVVTAADLKSLEDLSHHQFHQTVSSNPPIDQGKSSSEDTSKESSLSPEIRHKSREGSPSKSTAAESCNTPDIISPRNSLSVLIAEDTASIAKMTSMMLKRQGHKPFVAENGSIALEMFKAGYESSDAQKYDVILTDLQMPVMDGLEATRRIRAFEKTQSSTYPVTGQPRQRQLVIGVSANSDYETMKEGLEAGLDDFVSKPFTIATFNSTIGKYLPQFAVSTRPTSPQSLQPVRPIP
jgi:CheY-like chemotaxis protein